jgi:hypothetical protein
MALIAMRCSICGAAMPRRYVAALRDYWRKAYRGIMAQPPVMPSATNHDS